MKIALDATGKIGSGAARVLLAERSVEALGLIGRRSTSGDPRVSTITNLAGWDVLAIDDVEQLELRYRQASDHGIPLVLPADEVAFPADPDIPVVVGANQQAGLAACLAADERARYGNPLEVVVGWTEPGQPIRRGRPLMFPQPIGNLWAREARNVWPTAPAGAQFAAAPCEGPWSGLVTRVTAATSEGVEVRTIGVADDAVFLGSIALAAAAVAAAGGSFPTGLHYPTAAFPAYLEVARRAGLTVAAFVERQ
jgi:hypothetical protein